MQNQPDLRQSYTTDIHRMLPQSTDSELGLLGSILLLPNEVMGECVTKRISPEHFHVPAHATIFTILRELYDDAQPIDFILLTQILRDRGILDKVGGAAFVTNLFTFVPTAANASYYLEILKEKYTLRQAIVVCTAAASEAYESQQDPDGFLDALEAKISAIGQCRLSAKKFDMTDQVQKALAAIELLYERKGTISGLSTGFKDLDQLTDGLHPAEMIVIAARPSMGKSAIAMNIAEHVGVTMGIPVAVFSLEMSTAQLVQRVICSRSKINLQKVRDGFMTEGDFQRMPIAAREMAMGKIIIDDESGISILELKARARKMKREHDIQLIVIDYLQLLRGASKRSEDNRQQEVSEISSGIKGLAKELNIPIIVLAQLNRNPEGRAGGRPKLSDLRESGSIEQDADLVGLLHREEYYAEEGKAKEEAEGKATLIIAKQRSGPLDDVALTFLKQFTRFEDRAKTYDH